MHEIKVNFPTNKEEYKNGNGEGCWVLVDDDTFAEYDKDSTKKNCVGINGSDFNRKIIISAYYAFQIVIDFRLTKITDTRQLR